jgi:cytochrome P450
VEVIEVVGGAAVRASNILTPPTEKRICTEAATLQPVGTGDRMGMATAGNEPLEIALNPMPGRHLHDHLRALRDEYGPIAPVHFYGMPSFVILGYDELRAFFTAQEEFPGGEVYKHQLESTIGPTFISMDGSEHDVYRQLVTPAFRSRATTRFVDSQLTPLAHQMLDGIVSAGEGDLITGFADRLPFWAISRKLGLPDGYEDRQRGWAHALLSELSDPEGARVASAELTELIAPVIADRRSNPGDDVISQLVANEYNGRRLTDAEILSHVRLLFAVGATTTSDALSNLLWTLLNRPELLRRLRAEPESRPSAVRELLRWEPPVPLLPRMALNGGVIAGVEVPPMSIVLGGVAIANRDPAKFADPDTFDIDRPDADVLTFGFGSKFCPGSHLAKLQLLAALEVVLDRLPELELLDDEPGPEPSGCNLRSVSSLRCRWTVS